MAESTVCRPSMRLHCLTEWIQYIAFINQPANERFITRMLYWFFSLIDGDPATKPAGSSATVGTTEPLNARERAVERSGAGRSSAEGRRAASATKREMSNAKIERDKSYSFADSLYEFRPG